MRFVYLDAESKGRPARRPRHPSFAHLCHLVIPPTSLLSSLRSLPEFSWGGRGPSSYQIIASQDKCPPGLNVHEFQAYQTLCSGTVRRWPQILVELGSSNVNFSTEATTWLLSHLALEMGPPSIGS